MLILALFIPGSGRAVAAQEPADRLLEERRALLRGMQSRGLPGPVTPELETDLQDEPASVQEAGPVMMVQRIDVDAQGLLNDGELMAIIEPFLQLPLGRRRLDLLLRKLDARLVERGWVTSRVRLLSIDVESARVLIEVVPGRVARISASGMAPATVDRVVPVAAGEVLSLEALEQGVRQINRLRMYQAQVRISPGTAPATSLVDITLNGGRPWSVSIGADNQGARSTGAERWRLNGRFENLSGWLDDLQIGYLHSVRSDAALASWTIPAGFDLWSATVSASRSVIGLDGIDLHSRAFTAMLGWNHVLAISRERRDAWDVSLACSRLARSVGDTALAEDRSTVLRLAWNRTAQGDDRPYFVEPSLTFGLPALGATRDAPGLPPTHTHHEFTKWAFTAGWVVRIPYGGFDYAGQFSGQYSRASLIGQEQIHLGGLASVRGFDESVVSGDSGYLLRHEIRRAGVTNRNSVTVTPFVHMDHGAVWLVGGPRNSLASIGTGMRGGSGGAIWEAGVSVPVQREPDSVRRAWHFHFSVSYEI
ncbi:MAG TPA: ShlB/FhaC/HecB family hemolysin secretion/activation protein [Methyloversatilis sp.]